MVVYADSPMSERDVDPTSIAGTATSAVVDLDVIAADLADVELALARLDAGAYWTDEVTGEQLDEEWLVVHPTARRRATPDRATPTE
jgi:RNA polymerase-binding transcription factor DksA